MNHDETKPQARPSPSARTRVFTYSAEKGWAQPLDASLDSPQTLVIVFASATMPQIDVMLRELRASFPNALVVGCSTAGHVAGASLADSGASVSVTRFAKTTLRYAATKVSDASQSLDAAKTVAAQLAKPSLRSVFVLADPLHFNGDSLAQGFEQALPSNVVVTGGFAADDHRFADTWVIHDGKTESHRLSAVGFYGENLEVCFGSQGGWDIFGIERRITKSVGNVLYELDGKPALELYKNYLGEKAKELPASAFFFPLSVRPATGRGAALVRTILSVNEADQSMTFAGHVPEGHLAQMMKGSVERLIDGATYCAKTALPALPATPLMTIAISCMGRRMVLKQRTEEELEAILDAFPPDTPQIGFYSYGEISPSVPGTCNFHNESISLTAMYER